MYSKILVPLDTSKTAEQVLPHARYLAGKLGISVELLTVIDIAEIGRRIAADKAPVLNTLIENAVRSSESYLGAIAGTFSGVDVRVTVEKGVPDETIIEKGEADRSMLLAMATHGRSGLDRFLLGSVAEKVLRATANPLLLARAAQEVKWEGEGGFKTIIVPLDGSEVAEKVLPTVAVMAKHLGAEVMLVRVYHIPYTAFAADEGFVALEYDKLLAGVRDETNEYLEKKAAEVKNLGVEKVAWLAKEGLAADEIIALGRNTPDALIAMSSHGRSGVKRLMLGSVTETVVRHTRDPVLVVRDR
ncbi:MAG: universal stress protein [Candidatus Binatia bacterium]